MTAAAACPNCGAPVTSGLTGELVECTYCAAAIEFGAPGSTEPLRLSRIAIGDVDGDGHAELIGWRRGTRGTRLAAVDPIRGRIRWEVQAGERAGQAIFGGDRVHASSAEGRMVSIDVRTGRVVFDVPLGAPCRSLSFLRPPGPAIADPLDPGEPHAALLALSEDGVLRSFDRASGGLRFAARLEPEPFAWTCGGGRLSVGLRGAEPRVLVLDPRSDRPLATVPLEAGERAEVLHAGGVVYVIGERGRHRALRASDGTGLWEAEAGWSPEAGPGAVAAGRLFVADGRVVSALPDGSRRQMEGRIRGLRAAAGTLVAALDGTVLGLDPLTLRDRWRIDVGGGGTELHDNGRALVAALREEPLRLFGVAAFDGSRLWECRLRAAGRYAWHVVSADLVFVRAGTQYHVLRADSGARIWPI